MIRLSASDPAAGLIVETAFEPLHRQVITGAPEGGLRALADVLIEVANHEALTRARSGEAATALVSVPGAPLPGLRPGVTVDLSRDGHNHVAWGMVHRDPRLIDAFTIGDNLVYRYLSLGHDLDTARLMTYRVLDQAGLGTKAGAYPGQIGVVEQRIIGLIRDWDKDAEVMVIDDLFSDLDKDEADRLDGWLATWLGEHHGVRVIRLIGEGWRSGRDGDRISVVEHGKVIAQDTLAGLIKSPASAWIAHHLPNVVAGTFANGILHTAHDRQIATGDLDRHGPGVIAIHPRCIRVHRERPEGSAPNVWHGRVTGLEPYGNGVRVSILGLAPLVAEVTAASSRHLDLPIGGAVWASFKASLVEPYPAFG